MSLGIPEINRRIARNVGPYIELVRGEGYHYFAYDRIEENGALTYETCSLPIFATNQLTMQQWLSEAQAFANGMEVIRIERFALKAQIAEAQQPDVELLEITRTVERGDHTLGVALYGGTGPETDVIARFWLAGLAIRAGRALSASGLSVTLRDTRNHAPYTTWFSHGREVSRNEAKLLGLPFTAEETL